MRIFAPLTIENGNQFEMSPFFIDATFLLDDAENAFLSSAPLKDAQGKNTSVLYGAVRDLLRLRKSLGINSGMVVIGSDAADVSSVTNIDLFRQFLQDTGVHVLYKPKMSAGIICRSMLTNNSMAWIVTRNKSLMQLISAQCGIILMSAEKVPTVISESTLASRYHIAPAQVPSFLALTDPEPSGLLSAKQAARVLEIYGILNRAFDKPSVEMISPKIRRCLAENKELLQARLQLLTITDLVKASSTIPSGHIIRNNAQSRRACSEYGFPSLARLLEIPPKFDLIGPTPNCSDTYVAVIDQASLKKLEASIAKASVCALDTESTDKDPRKATLLGVALAVSEGNAFYIPLTQADLRDISADSLIKVLKRLLNTNIKIIGHNLKYDYVLLRRHGVRLNSLHFDTMLAAHECFGDWDFFNLGVVAKKLVGMNLKRYRDIVDDGHTLQDIPLNDVVEHGCADADAALRLYHYLSKVLKEKGIESQFHNHIMPLMQLLGDKELDGVRVDIGLIEAMKNELSTEAKLLKTSISATIGKDIELDSMKEIAALFCTIEELRDKLGRRQLRQSEIEQLAQENGLARSIAQYRRLQNNVKSLESICRDEKNGSVFPIFSQMKPTHGNVSSTAPSLFDLDGVLKPEILLDKEIRQLMPNVKQTLIILHQLTGDQTLQKDLQTSNKDFIGNDQAFTGLNHGDVLISLAVGASNAMLCKKFLISPRRANDLRESIIRRYPKLFAWLDECKRGIACSGFASSGDMRRYWDGLKSSDLDKRNKAQRSALRWVIGM